MMNDHVETPQMASPNIPLSSQDAGDGIATLRQTIQKQTGMAVLPTATYDVLVLDALLRQSLVSVRSLGSKGLRVAALDTIGSVPAFSSRWCQQQFICPSSEAT